MTKGPVRYRSQPTYVDVWEKPARISIPVAGGGWRVSVAPSDTAPMQPGTETAGYTLDVPASTDQAGRLYLLEEGFCGTQAYRARDNRLRLACYDPSTGAKTKTWLPRLTKVHGNICRLRLAVSTSGRRWWLLVATESALPPSADSASLLMALRPDGTLEQTWQLPEGLGRPELVLGVGETGCKVGWSQRYTADIEVGSRGQATWSRPYSESLAQDLHLGLSAYVLPPGSPWLYVTWPRIDSRSTAAAATIEAVSASGRRETLIDLSHPDGHPHHAATRSVAQVVAVGADKRIWYLLRTPATRADQGGQRPPAEMYQLARLDPIAPAAAGAKVRRAGGE